MSITDELRKYVQSWRETPNLMDDLDAGDIDGLLGDFVHIADRIDAERQKALDERDSERFNTLMDAREKGVSAVLKEPGGFGLVELPKDADGEYIHVGDRLDGYGKTITVVEMRHGRSGWVLISRDGNGYADTFAFTHHKPTVEDLLREMLDAWGELPSNATNEAIIAKYAKRLTLAEGEDA